MPVRKGLFKLYDAKRLVMEELRTETPFETAETNLWLAVIEQAIFDAHLHTTGGKHPSTVYVRDARSWIGGHQFSQICEQLDLEPRWVQELIEGVGRMARQLRGNEYEQAAVSAHDKKSRHRRAHAD